MSPPALNALSPAPVTTIARTASSAPSSSNSDAISSRAPSGTRLSFSGTSRVIVTTPRSSSRSTRSKPLSPYSPDVTPVRSPLAACGAGSCPTGSSGGRPTKRYSRGRLKPASSASARQWASSSSAVSRPRGRRRDHPLAPALVGLAHDRDLGTAGGRARTSSTSSGMDVLAARDDHVVDPADDPEVAVLVEAADVARCSTSRRGSPSRRRPAGSSSRRTPRRSSSHMICRPRRGTTSSGEALASRRRAAARVDRRPAGAARLRRLVAVDRERVDLGRAVVVEEHAGRNASTQRSTSALASARRRSRALDRREVVLGAAAGAWTRSWKSVGAR